MAERGVDSRKVHVIEGVPDVKIAVDHLYTAAELCTPKLPLPMPERIDVDGRDVLAVTVPEVCWPFNSSVRRYLSIRSTDELNGQHRS